MAVKEVLRLGEASLWEEAPPVPDPTAPQVGILVEDLHDTLLDWRRRTTYGRGIAAPQIGAAARVVVLDLGERWPLINPAIRERSPETVELWDACLCFLDIFFTVQRHVWIDVSYEDLRGETHRLRAEGELAELLQHEIDHVDGILALARMTDVRSMCSREHFERHHRDESPYRVGGRGS